MNDNIKRVLDVYGKNPSSIQNNIDVAKEYFELGQYAAACSLSK